MTMCEMAMRMPYYRLFSSTDFQLLPEYMASFGNTVAFNNYVRLRKTMMKLDSNYIWG